MVSKIKLHDAFIWFLAFLLIINACKKNESNNEKTKPTASFTVDKESGDSPLTVQFTNTSVNAVSYKWDFGDGTKSTEKNPTHIFTNPSTTSMANVTVSLTTYGADSITANCTKVITINKSKEISPEFNPDKTYGTMSDQDGNVYKTITIGTQTWMAENLRTTKFRDGTPIPNITDDNEWLRVTSLAESFAYCTFKNTKKTDSIATFGMLYNTYAAKDPRIAPIGWHLPTEEEWTILITFLGVDSVAGGKMKETGTTHWNAPNRGATNESGFTACPSGFRHIGDDIFFGRTTFYSLGDIAVYWSTSYLPYYTLVNNSFFHHKQMYLDFPGMSIRLIKD